MYEKIYHYYWIITSNLKKKKISKIPDFDTSALVAKL